MSAKKPMLEMPEDVHQALEAGELLDVFAARPDKQRNGYIAWVAESRREVTRRKRIRQMLEELYAGDVYLGASWGQSSARPKKH
jgi:uncharacterized protein YdeI (YjbR/CyaY-like superfamily)